MNTATFHYFPGFEVVQEVWFVLIFLLASLAYPLWRISTGGRVLKFELYLSAFFVAGVILPAFSAWHVFGQPVLFGIAAERKLSLLGGVFLILIALRTKKLKIEDLKAGFLIAGWFLCALYTVMRLTLDPAKFAGTTGFVIAGPNPAFAFPSELLVFGILYYTLRGLRWRKRSDYLRSAVLLACALSISGTGRALLVALAGTLAVFLFLLRPAKEGLKLLTKFALASFLFLGISLLANPAAVTERASLFGDAFLAISGTAGNDVSAGVRILEVATAWPFIQQNPLLGNGELSHQWEEGPAARLAYFSSDDIGLIGVVFTYGIFGLVFFAAQYLFAIKAGRRVFPAEYIDFVTAIKANLLFTALSSLTTGAFIFDAKVTLLLIAILYGVPGFASDRHNTRKGDAVCLTPTPA